MTFFCIIYLFLVCIFQVESCWIWEKLYNYLVEWTMTLLNYHNYKLFPNFSSKMWLLFWEYIGIFRGEKIATAALSIEESAVRFVFFKINGNWDSSLWRAQDRLGHLIPVSFLERRSNISSHHIAPPSGWAQRQCSKGSFGVAQLPSGGPCRRHKWCGECLGDWLWAVALDVSPSQLSLAPV